MRGRSAARGDELKPLYQKGDMNRGRPSYPDELNYHSRARLGADGGDSTTFGITWYAQDSLGEVVFFDPPEVGATVPRTILRRGRVGQGGLRRVRAAVG